MIHTAAVHCSLSSPSDRQKVITEVLSANCVEAIVGEPDSAFIGILLRAIDREVILEVLDQLYSHASVTDLSVDFTGGSSWTIVGFPKKRRKVGKLQDSTKKEKTHA